MNFFLILGIIILLEFFRNVFITNYNIFYSYFWIKNERRKFKIRDPKKRIHIIIPIFNEEKIIDKTLKYFKKINYPFLKIYIVTTKKEKELDETINKLSKYLGSDKVYHIHYPFSIGDKASQINFAVKNIKIKEEDYIAIYDVDSRPEKNTFWYVGSDSQDSDIYQQFSLYFKDFNKIPYISKAGSFLQTRWSFGYELKKAINNSPLVYCIGHGLFIKKKVFDDLGGFPEDSLAEDLSFGYWASSNGVKIKPIPFFDNAEYAPDFKSAVVQSSRWFGGETESYKRIDFKKRKIWNTLFFIKRAYEISHWIIGPPLFALIFVYFITSKSSLLIGLSFAFLFFLIMPWYVLLLLKKDFFREISNERLIFNKLIIVYFLYLKYLLNFIGPIYFLYLKTKTFLNSNEIPFIKTKRI